MGATSLSYAAPMPEEFVPLCELGALSAEMNDCESSIFNVVGKTILSPPSLGRNRSPSAAKPL